MDSYVWFWCSNTTMNILMIIVQLWQIRHYLAILYIQIYLLVHLITMISALVFKQMLLKRITSLLKEILDFLKVERKKNNNPPCILAEDGYPWIDWDL